MANNYIVSEGTGVKGNCYNIAAGSDLGYNGLNSDNPSYDPLDGCASIETTTVSATEYFDPPNNLHTYFVKTLELPARSTFINAGGDSSVCTGPLSSDQVGKLPIQDCDVGAYEFDQEYIIGASYNINEDGNPLEIVISRTGGSLIGDAPLMLSFSGALDEDYILPGATRGGLDGVGVYLDFTRGAASMSFNVAAVNDHLTEGDEEINIMPSLPHGMRINRESSVITIHDTSLGSGSGGSGGVSGSGGSSGSGGGSGSGGASGSGGGSGSGGSSGTGGASGSGTGGDIGHIGGGGVSGITGTGGSSGAAGSDVDPSQTTESSSSGGCNLSHS